MAIRQSRAILAGATSRALLPPSCEQLHYARHRSTNSIRYASSTKHKPETLDTSSDLLSRLPYNCTGCGAFTQLQDPKSPGFYSFTRRPIRSYLAHQGNASSKAQEATLFRASLSDIALSRSHDLGIEEATNGAEASFPTILSLLLIC